jgi:hypothetical protein
MLSSFPLLFLVAANKTLSEVSINIDLTSDVVSLDGKDDKMPQMHVLTRESGKFKSLNVATETAHKPTRKQKVYSGVLLL